MGRKAFKGDPIYETFIVVQNCQFSWKVSEIFDNDINFVNCFPEVDLDFQPILENIVKEGKGQRKNSERIQNESLKRESALVILSHFDQGDFSKTRDFSVEKLKRFRSFPKVLAILGCESNSLNSSDRDYLLEHGVETLILSCKKLSLQRK